MGVDYGGSARNTEMRYRADRLLRYPRVWRQLQNQALGDEMDLHFSAGVGPGKSLGCLVKW